MGSMFSKRVPKDMAEVKNFVDTLIATKAVVVYSKTWCTYCKRLRSGLKSFSIKEDALEWVEIDKRDDTAEIQDYLLEVTGGRTVPRVFIGGEFFGGCDETLAAKKSGLLEQKLKSVGAI